MTRRRVGACVSAFAVAAALLVAPAAAGATGIPNDASRPIPAVVSLEGLLRVIPVEEPPLALTADALPESVDAAGPAPHDGAHETGDVEVSLVTDEGAVVPLALDDASHAEWGGAASGSRFAGAVEVPDEIADAVAERADTDRADDAAVAALVADAAAELDVALPVVDATLDPPALTPPPDADPDAPPVLAAAAPREHTLDVLWLTMAGFPQPQAADLQAAIGRLSDFWATESNGQISGVVPRVAMQFRTVPFSPCDERRTWTYAAGQFGRTEASYWSGATASHLVVLVDAALCGPGSGLGTYGAGIHSGGLVWGTIELGMPREWDQVLFHEFGHNIGLPHANARVCAVPKVDSAVGGLDGVPSDPDCADHEYRDRYDVMGGGMWVDDSRTGDRIVSTMRDVAALSVTQKAKLDALPRGSALRTLSVYDAASGGGTVTLDIAPISATSGTRGLELIDPVTQEVLTVEYRSGTGRDTQSLYAQWPAAIGSAHFAPGVRVLRSYPDTCAFSCRIGYSTVLHRHAGAGVVAQWLGVGDALTSYTGGVTVRVVAATADGAAVEVSFSDGLERFAARAAPALQGAVDGTARFGQRLTVTGIEPTAWTPAATGVTVRWLRNGQLISGVSGPVYTLGGADVGKAITARVFATRAGFTPASADTATVTVTAPAVERLSGPTRYETAVEVSRRAFPGTAPVIYLATGTDYPDALAAAPAAAAAGAPVLLVPSAGAVPRVVLDRVAELQPSRIVVVGGAAVVPEAAVSQVRARVPAAAVDRRGGADRYATARAVVERSFTPGVDAVYLATGRDFPDALSAAATAGAQGAPVLLIDGRAERVDAATRAALARLAPGRLHIVGGAGVIGEGLAADLATIAPTTRLSGPSRYDTSVAVNAQAFATGPVARQYWATGEDFPDALSGASLAAAQQAPLFVVPRACVPPATAAETARTAVQTVTLIGGPGALGPGVEGLSLC